MDRTLRSLFFLVFFASFLSLRNTSAFSEIAPNAELEGILQKIESRHYRWIAIRADVLLFFAKGGDPAAMCGGELLYQRLDERIFLSCVDMQSELVFAFRTLDRRFDLYLPAQNTVYHGSIFDLEDSPDIESHLKARDLYRALKPMAVDSRRAKVERANSAITSLDVYSPGGTKETLIRKLYLTPEGDVRGEIFYGVNGRSVTEIQRYDFREIRGHVGSFDSIIFPKKVTIISPETKKGSAIFFTKVKAMDTIDPLEFILRVPPGTKEVFLDEKDPRFQHSKTKGGEARPMPQASRAAPRQFKPETKQVKKILQTPLPRKEEAPEIAKPASVPEAASVKTPASENADADIAVESETSKDQPSGPDDQTTLDPSVEPSV